jgi:D-alanyl-D-alanine carboxypeptidase (penicillin-binding protein 5/6)
MTAEVVFHELTEGRLKLDDQFTVSEHAWRTGGAGAGGSAMFLQINSRVRIEDLLHGLIVQSGNDAAITLAEGIAGSEEVFGNVMTQRARELGFQKLTFRNPWGKADPAQRVTAREMAQLALHVINTYPQYYKIFGEKEFTWSKIRQTNRNPLLFMDIGADGLKTGNIDDSGYGLVGSAVDKDTGQRLVVVVYGARKAQERADEARKLLQWGFRAFETKTVFAAGEAVGTASVYGGAQREVEVAAQTPVRLLVPRGSGERLTGKIVYTGPLPAPVQEGQEVARLKIARGTVQALDVPLVALASVDVGSLPQRALDAGLEYATAIFRKYVPKK